MSYVRFFAMIVTSTVIMYGLMYLNTYAWDHVYFSETRVYMALYMGAMMAVVMLAFMLKMYKDKAKNVAIFVGSAVVFALALFLLRSQVTVQDASWMRAMIPHHSIAILTSSRAELSDPRVRRLADEIVLAQRREIAEMQALLRDLDGSEYEGAPIPPDVPEVTGGSAEATGPVPGAPALFASGTRRMGDVLIVDSVKVVSDAWLVAHPQAEGGGADAARVLGRAFVQHGTTARVPVDLRDAPAQPVVLMLHADTGEIGRFEFAAGGPLDPPLTDAAGRPLTRTVTLE